MAMRLLGGEGFLLKISLQDSGTQSSIDKTSAGLARRHTSCLNNTIWWILTLMIVWKVKNQLLSVLYEIYRYVDRVVDYIDDISENACNIQLVSWKYHNKIYVERHMKFSSSVIQSYDLNWIFVTISRSYQNSAKNSRQLQPVFWLKGKYLKWNLFFWVSISL